MKRVLFSYFVIIFIFSLLVTTATVTKMIAMQPHVTPMNAVVPMLIPIIARVTELRRTP